MACSITMNYNFHLFKIRFKVSVRMWNVSIYTIDVQWTSIGHERHYKLSIGVQWTQWTHCVHLMDKMTCTMDTMDVQCVHSGHTAHIAMQLVNSLFIFNPGGGGTKTANYTNSCHNISNVIAFIAFVKFLHNYQKINAKIPEK